MYGNVKPAKPIDEALIDDRNERPLTIALAAIVAVWSIVFALTFASGHAGPHSAFSAGGVAAVMSSMDK